MSKITEIDNQGNSDFSYQNGSEANRCNDEVYAEELAISCICPRCGELLMREGKKPCYEKECPMCGTKMIRNWYD